MRVLCIDPGANPGFCLTDHGQIEYASCEGPPYEPVIDELVVEDQFAAAYIYRNGSRVRVSRKSQMTLARTAGMLFERYDATRKYRIGPDQWRRILWPGANRLTKTVVLARLTPAYGHLVATYPKKNQPDVLEAIGIAMGWAGLTQEQKEPYRVRS